MVKQKLFAVQIIFDVINQEEGKLTDVMLYSAKSKKQERKKQTRNIVIPTHTHTQTMFDLQDRTQGEEDRMYIKKKQENKTKEKRNLIHS